VPLVYGRADQLPPSWLRVWLFGPPGSGKTIAASTFPDPFFLTSHNEDSIKSLRGAPIRFATVIPNNDVRTEVLGFIDRLNSLAMTNLNQLRAEFGQTLVIDAFTHLQDSMISEIANLNINRASEKGKMDEPKWGLLRSYLLNLRDQLWRLPMHVIITSLESVSKAGQGGVAGAGAGTDRLASSCDALGYCDTDPSGTRVVHFQKYGVFPARTRFGLQGMGPGPYRNSDLWSAFAPFLGQR